MAFVEKIQSSGKNREFLTASSTEIKRGDAVTFDGGYIKPVTAAITAGTPIAIACQDVTTVAGEHQAILVCLVDPTMEFVVDTKTQATQEQVGTAVKFEGANAVDNETAGGSFRILEVLPNKKVIGKFY